MLTFVIFAVSVLTSVRSQVFEVNVTRGQVFVHEISKFLSWTDDGKINHYNHT